MQAALFPIQHGSAERIIHCGSGAHLLGIRRAPRLDGGRALRGSGNQWRRHRQSSGDADASTRRTRASFRCDRRYGSNAPVPLAGRPVEDDRPTDHARHSVVGVQERLDSRATRTQAASWGSLESSARRFALWMFQLSRRPRMCRAASAFVVIAPKRCCSIRSARACSRPSRSSAHGEGDASLVCVAPASSSDARGGATAGTAGLGAARIERLKERLRRGDPDMTPDEVQAAIERAEAKARELCGLVAASGPAMKRSRRCRVRPKPTGGKSRLDSKVSRAQR